MVKCDMWSRHHQRASTYSYALSIKIKWQQFYYAVEIPIWISIKKKTFHVWKNVIDDKSRVLAYCSHWNNAIPEKGQNWICHLRTHTKLYAPSNHNGWIEFITRMWYIRDKHHYFSRYNIMFFVVVKHHLTLQRKSLVLM